MTTRQTSIDEDEFQAFVDGQLPPERCRAVMAYLAAHPDESSRMGDYRTLSEELHSLYDEVLYEPLPARLRVDHYRGRTSWRDRLQRWFGFSVFSLTPRLVGLAALLSASATGGWLLHSNQIVLPEAETPAMSFARQATSAHLVYAPDVRHPVEFGADQEENMLLWLSERLGATVHVPRLQDINFTLVGGRLLPAEGEPAAQLMYEDPQAQRITLYIRSRWKTSNAGQPERSVSYAAEGKVGLVYWIEGPFAYALIGAMDREQLFATAETVQQQLTMPVIPPAPEQTATTEKDAT
ncbi:MAG TPA: anti-sigma factor [Geminicoccaceae bacterium]|nr:anti-sigma factor [Geminicoccaceae bacterium]